MSTTDTPKTRTITMTGRAPVKIIEDDWPVIASAKGDSWAGSDHGKWQQALSQGECDTYFLKVRQHADGRALVYAVLNAAISAWHAPAGGIDKREGRLLKAGDDIAGAISEVGEMAGIPDKVIDACIADLPAEEI